GFSKCRLSLAVPHRIDYNGIGWFNGRRIATSYPSILSKFLQKNGIDAEIQVITGSVEIAPGIGLADAIFDIVSSGSTLVSNNLVEVERVVDSQAVLIGACNRLLPQEKQVIFDELLFRFDAVKAADGKKYVLMNVPREKLAAVISVLPVIKSPTILPLANDDWCSVHAVLEERRLWEIVSKLKTAGAEGILTLDIEKMIL
ncbi:MAG: ATP phosphoribosyltransferase, partial [Muribaculaceae bacterium]|nr:ATP phosphoribosyltransferase [Muribaculaceae bacterium]